MKFSSTMLLPLFFLVGCATTADNFGSVGDDQKNPFYIPRSDTVQYAHLETLSVGGGFSTPYSKNYFYNNSVTVKRLKQSKVFITNLIYEHYDSSRKIVKGKESWGRVDRVIVLCEKKYLAKPIATLSIQFLTTSNYGGEVIETKLFDVNEMNLESHLRPLEKYGEMELYRLTCVNNP